MSERKERTTQGEAQSRSSLSQDVLISYRGRRVVWAERLFRMTVGLLIRLYFRLSLWLRQEAAI